MARALQPARRFATSLFTLIATSSCIAITAAPATASDGSAAIKGCPTREYYDIVGHSAYHIRGKGLPVFKDGRGGEITGTVSVATTVSATISTGASLELGGVLAKAKAEISLSLTASVGVTVGHSYKHVISANKYGNLQYGSWGQRVTWKKLRDSATCSTTVLKSGTATIPTNKIGWNYWETSS